MNAHVKTTSIIAGTMLTTDMARCRKMLEGVLGMECVQPGNGLMYARHPAYKKGGSLHGQPYWVLEVRETGAIEVPQEMLNHWGVNAPSQAAVDEAYARVNAAKEEFGITRVQKPRFRNGTYAVYFVDKDTNWWEVEYRTPDLTYEVLRAKGDLA